MLQNRSSLPAATAFSPTGEVAGGLECLGSHLEGIDNLPCLSRTRNVRAPECPFCLLEP